MSQNRSGAAWAGLGLIALGVLLLLAQWIGWNRIWPIFPLLGGMAFLVGYVISGFKDAGLVFVGTAATLVGLFFFGFSLGVWEWEQMLQLWPVFPLIGGLAFLALFLAQGPGRDPGTLGIGCAAIIVGGVGLAVTYGLVGGDIIRLWPLLIILVGLIGLTGGLIQLFRQK